MAEKDLELFTRTIGNKSITLQKEMSIIDAAVNYQLKAEKQAQQDRAKLIADYQKKIDQLSKTARTKKDYDELNRYKNLLAAEETAEEKHQQYIKKLKNQATLASEVYAETSYKKFNQRQKLDYQKSISEQLKQKKQQLSEQFKFEKAQIEHYTALMNDLSADDKTRSFAADQVKQLSAQHAITKTDLSSVVEQDKTTSKLIEDIFNNIATPAEKAQVAAENYTKAEQKRAQRLAEAKSANEALAESEKALKKSKKSDPSQVKALEQEVKEKRKAAEAAEALAASSEEAAKQMLKQKQAAEEAAEGSKTLEDSQKGWKNALNNVAGAVNNQIEARLTSLYGQQGRMNARLQTNSSSIFDWSKSVYEVSSKVGFSPLVSQQKVVEAMTKLVDSGVAYNVELRAFLAETSENIASTFDAFDSNLLRLIRLQQADTTAARLGMESSLTKLFNEYFKDTSYLNKGGAADTVSAALFEASATMNKNDSLAFEYAVQKWLGSLYSLGISDKSTQSIAEGLSYLATGNVSALSNNSALQTLFAMSAARAGGKSYAEMLTSGITANETNDLLRAMIEYLAEIAASQENYVTKSAYAELFGMSLSDFSSFTNLTTKEIENLYKETQDYNSLNKEVQNQLNVAWTRLNATQIVDTIMDNAFTGSAQMIGSNPVTYGLWKALNMVQGLAELEIPGIQAMGTGTASGIKVFEVAKLGMAGAGMLASLLSAIGSATNPNIESFLDKWKFKEYTPRGSTLSLLQSGTSSSTSLSAMMGTGSASAEDVESTSLETSQKKGSDALDNIQSEELGEVANMEQKIWEAVADESGNTVLKTLMQMCGAMESGESGLPSAESNVATSSGGETSNSAESTTSSSSSEMYSKIYEAISAGESVNVLTVLQEINDKLNQDRVFYTAMSTTSSSVGTVGAITDISAQIQGNKIPVVSDEQAGVTFTNPHINRPSSATSLGGGLFNSETAAEDLQLIISTAVETALRAVAGYSSGDGLPVVVTNLNNYGG